MVAAVLRTNPEPAAVLAKATMNAAIFLGLTQCELATVLGISEPSVSRIATKDRSIDPASHEGQAALMLIRIFRALDLLVGGNSDAKNAWMTSYNRAIGAVPKVKIQKLPGLVHTVDYLDGMKGAA
jgi:hypothetical protein